jgi:hypothetical protein
LKVKLAHILVPEVPKHLKEKLPEYMIPSAFVPLFVPTGFKLEQARSDAADRLSGPSFAAQMERPLRIDVFAAQRMEVLMSYYKRHFAEESVSRMLKDVTGLFEAIQSDPGQRLWSLLESI